MPRTKEFTFVVETPLSRPAAERAYRELVELVSAKYGMRVEGTVREKTAQEIQNAARRTEPETAAAAGK